MDLVVVPYPHGLVAPIEWARKWAQVWQNVLWIHSFVDAEIHAVREGRGAAFSAAFRAALPEAALDLLERQRSWLASFVVLHGRVASLLRALDTLKTSDEDKVRLMQAGLEQNNEVRACLAEHNALVRAWAALEALPVTIAISTTTRTTWREDESESVEPEPEPEPEAEEAEPEAVSAAAARVQGPVEVEAEMASEEASRVRVKHEQASYAHVVERQRLVHCASDIRNVVEQMDRVLRLCAPPPRFVRFLEIIGRLQIPQAGESKRAASSGGGALRALAGFSRKCLRG